MEKFSATETPLKGTNLIEASAGTGKTFTISMIYLRLIVEKGFRIDEILVVTFTLPATMELRLRIRKVISEALRFCETGSVEDETIAEIIEPHKGDAVVVQRLRSAMKSFDEASVYTIHSFCQQVLSDSAFESGALFSSDIVTDDTARERFAADFWRENVYTLPEHLASFIIKKESPYSLLELYRKRPLSPALRLFPEAGTADTGEIKKLAAKAEEIYRRIIPEWERDGDEASEFLCEGEGLNRNKYRANKMPERVEALRNYIASGNWYEFPDVLEFFTKSKIEASLRKGGAAPELPVFECAELLFNAAEEYLAACGNYLLNMKKKLFTYIDDKCAEYKGESGRRGFDDLIRDLQVALGGDGGAALAGNVRDRYRAALIDEFQDTDDLQYEIFKNIFGRSDSILFLIGDPKQAIYRFRGADIFSYLKASGDVKSRYTLARNFRSVPDLIKGVNMIFSRTKTPFVFDRIEFNPVEPGIADQGEYLYNGKKRVPAMDIGIVDYAAVKNGEDDNDSMILRQIASEISALAGESGYRFMPSDTPVHLQDIAVLVRSHSHAAAVQGILSKHGIPSLTRGHESVFETPEADELCRVLLAIAEPGRVGRLKSAAATSLSGYNADSIYRFNAETPEGVKELGEITERFYSYRETWLRNGFMDMFTLYISGEGVAARVLGRQGGERVMANVVHMAELLNMVQFENSFSPDELATWMESAVLEPPSGDEYSIRLDKDSDAVNIVTMHASKGLEYPVVFCPYLTYAWQSSDDAPVFHEKGPGFVPVLCLDKAGITDEMKERRREEDLAENVRLMYVALTRAKSMCRVLFMMKSDFAKSAPAHVIAGDLLTDAAGADDRYSVFSRSLRDIADNSGGAVCFSVIKGRDIKKYASSWQAVSEFMHREFTGEINTTWGMQSYSSITRSLEDGKGDGSYGRVIEEGSGIFAFPRGARAGLCLHEIFELTDFTEADAGNVSETVQSVLRKYGYEDFWVEDVTGMFFNVTGAVLPGSGGTSLSDIGMGSRLSEMEFNFPLGGFSVAALREIFSTASGYGKAVYERLGRDESVLSGMMKGFIDLVFRIGNRYYIADWKSNILGITTEDYNLRMMEEEMLHHNYHLQYYLYTVALHRYLSLRLGDSYSYSENFGGVYYFFIRGITVGEGSGGIFYSVPDEATVLRLDDFFRGEDLT